jgi:hypothetical protein
MGLSSNHAVASTPATQSTSGPPDPAPGHTLTRRQTQCGTLQTRPPPPGESRRYNQEERYKTLTADVAVYSALSHSASARACPWMAGWQGFLCVRE